LVRKILYYLLMTMNASLSEIYLNQTFLSGLILTDESGATDFLLWESLLPFFLLLLWLVFCLRRPLLPGVVGLIPLTDLLSFSS